MPGTLQGGSRLGTCAGMLTTVDGTLHAVGANGGEVFGFAGDVVGGGTLSRRSAPCQAKIALSSLIGLCGVSGSSGPRRASR